MKSVAALLITIFCLFLSCKKVDKSDTHILGTVIDAETQKPIGGLQIKLEYLDGDGGMGLVNFSRPLGETTTDENGQYDFSFMASIGSSGNDRYRLNCGSTNYFGFGAEPSCYDADGKITTLNFESYKRILITLRLLHPSANPNDLLSIDAIQTITGYESSDIVFGSDTNRTMFVGVVPNNPIEIKYHIRRNNIQQPEQTEIVTFSSNSEEHKFYW